MAADKVKFDQLIAEQRNNMEELQKALSNYKKSPIERKTLEYLEKKQKAIDSLWLIFQKQDNRLRNELPESHPYFKEDYYGALGEKYSSIRTEIDEEIVKARVLAAKARANGPPTGATSSNINMQQEVSRSQEDRPSTQGISFRASPNLDYQKQRQIIATVRRIINETIVRTDGLSSQFFELQLSTIQQHWRHAQMLHEKLWTMAEDSGQYDFDGYLEVEREVNEGILQITNKMLAFSAPQSDMHANRAPTSALNLPKIDLPRFDGNYLQWRQFHDLFCELVHNSNLPSCQKLMYLKSSLSGEAKGLISHFTTTAVNYEAAWNVLIERYDNKRIIVSALLTKLLSQPQASSENPNSLKLLHDVTNECMLSLQGLNIPTTNWDPLILHNLVQRLGKTTHSLWEQSLKNPKELPNLKEFLHFLKIRFQSLEALSSKHTIEHPKRILSASATVHGTCAICQNEHQIQNCPKFLQLTPPERLRKIQSLRRCANCLKDGHKTKTCKNGVCVKCQGRHNTLLHLERVKNPGCNSTTSVAKQQSSPVTLTAVERGPTVLLSTVQLYVISQEGKRILCRAILDSGSQANFITKSLVKKLGLATSSCHTDIEGIGQCSKAASAKVNVEIGSATTGFTSRLEVLLLSKIVANQPTQKILTNDWKIPNNIKLADPTFNEPGPIDLLIGSGIFFEILCVGQISLGEGLPTLQNSLLGWLVGGKYDHHQTTSQPLTCGICIEDITLNEKLERFWQIEECEPQNNNLTAAERKCENFYTQTTRRAQDGRYVVRLPYQQEACHLGESEDIALQRFKAVERKLRKEPNLKAAYVSFMTEYEKLGHMVKVPRDNINKPYYFLPHHAVLRPDSSTTKLRVVFDASSKTSSNMSLNDILFKGPSIQDDVFTILMRFRQPRYAMTADIEKMYRQIWVDEEDRNMQLVWWRSDEAQPLECYQLKTVTYGTSAAPYLAIRTLRALATDLGSKFPLGAEAIRTNFYVDDVLSGSDSLPEALEIQEQLIIMLKLAGMNLRKWVANHPRLLEAIPPADREVMLDFSNPNATDVKTMGLMWDPSNDLFKLKIGKVSHSAVTKRTILSDVAQIFDPLGFIAPVTATAKIFLQKLWQLKMDWDAALPQELHTTWMQIREEFGLLQQIGVPRHVRGNEMPTKAQVHIFCDASERAYGAVAYLRSSYPQGNLIIRFLCAKSKVAPVKQITLPRLELCAAKLAVEVFTKLQETNSFKETEAYFWTDSTAVLGWINAESANYHTFIANRIAAIQRSSSPQNWHHVRSADNPADLLSRGLTPSKLVNNNFWFYGPKFLHGSLSCWPLQPPKELCALELRKKQQTSLTTVTTSTGILDDINHKNSFHRLQRILAYVLKFSNRSRGRVELQAMALVKIVKVMQTTAFQEEIDDIKKHNAVKNRSPLSSLTPFFDEDGLVRVGGRLEASSLSFDAKHPIILPCQHPFTKLLLETIHRDNLHAGPQTLMSIVRQRFWPLKLKMIARSVVKNCVKCARAKPQLMNQLMGNLPADRVHPNRPFVISGVDFFGPLWTHFKIRGKRPLKAYVAVFCCFATKAVHMELVSDLTTEAFVGALKRFIARRGHCAKIYCDNATNFVGAKNYIQELQAIIHSDDAINKIQHECSKRGMEFLFIPPRAPHFGGLWEAAVKSAKKLLLTALSAANLTYEETETLIIEAEAILNSRPLTPMSSDPNDFQALTPGHFLIGEPLTSTIDPKATPNKTNSMTRWKLVNQLKHEFWQRWLVEYLSTLQNRYKWKKEADNIQPGTMVIIKEDNLPAMRWPLGRILKAIPGSDGLVRVADVQTANNICRRPIHRLAPLPVETQNDSICPEEGLEQPDTKQKSSVPSKRRRLTHSSTSLSLLLICLLLPLCFGNLIEVKPFKKDPGLYFERLGTAGITASEWNLISYIDMQSYWKKFEVIKQYPAAIQRAANGSLSQHGSTITKLLEGLLDEISMQNQLLKASKPLRHKRGAINLVGNIANALFGVLDATYAEEAEKIIAQIKQNEDYLATQINKQTSFLDTTMNILKKNQNETNEELKGISKLLYRLQNQQVVAETVTELAIQATLDMLHLERIQDSLLDILISSHHGKLSPELVTPSQLQIELNNIKTNLPQHLKLPAPADELLNFYKLMTIEGRATGNYVIFKITIPLLTNEDFEILKIVSIPWSSNGTFYKIQSSLDYLVINLHRDRYMTFKEAELSKCILINKEAYVCHQQYPFYKKGSTTARCEVELLSSNSINSSCDVQSTSSGPHWIQLHNPNMWVYSVGPTYVANAVCGAAPNRIALAFSGILMLRADCNIKQPFITIQGYQKFETIKHQYYVSTIDVSELTSPRNTTQELPISSKSNELDNIHKKLSELHVNLPNKLRPHDIHHYTISYVCLAILAVLGCVIYCKFRTGTSNNREDYNSTATSTNPSVVQPARRSNPEDDSFITISC